MSDIRLNKGPIIPHCSRKGFYIFLPLENNARTFDRQVSAHVPGQQHDMPQSAIVEVTYCYHSMQ